jgi:hypothetical protein
MVKSESDVVGEYELKAANGKIALRLSPDKSFSETINWCGKVESRSGKWRWSPGTWLWSHEVIVFDQLWMPPGFEPHDIDASAIANRQPKYTEPGCWSMSPERHWGTIILPIFPDADVSFKMVRPSRE